MKAILSATRAGTWEWNTIDRNIIVNDQWFAMLGYTRGDFSGVTMSDWEQLSHPDDWKVAAERMREHLIGRSPEFECTIRMKHKDGDWRWVLARGMKVDDEGAGEWLVGSLLDITKEARLNAHLENLSKSVPGIIYSFVSEPDKTQYFSYIGGKTESFFGVASEKAKRNYQALFKAVHPDDHDKIKETTRQSRESMELWKCDYRVQLDGCSRWVRGLALPEKDLDGTVTWHGLVIDIDEQKRLERKLEYQALTDSLTDLFNRRYLVDRLEKSVADVKRYGGSIALACIDVDYFKQINDLH